MSPVQLYLTRLQICAKVYLIRKAEVDGHWLSENACKGVSLY